MVDQAGYDPGRLRQCRLRISDRLFLVMTDPKFHFSCLNEQVWFACGRNRARSQSNANTPRIINCSLSGGDHLIQRSAERRAGAANFPHQYLPRDTTTLGGLRFRSRRDIIVSHHGLHFDAFGCGQLLGHFYIQVIARVIPVEASDSCSTVRHPECVEERLGGGRTKYLPDGDSVAEVFANIANKRWLVSRSASGNDTDLPLTGALTYLSTRGFSGTAVTRFG